MPPSVFYGSFKMFFLLDNKSSARCFCSHINILGSQRASTPHLHLMIRMLRKWLVKGPGKHTGTDVLEQDFSSRPSKGASSVEGTYPTFTSSVATTSARGLSEHNFKRTTKKQSQSHSNSQQTGDTAPTAGCLVCQALAWCCAAA